MKIRGIIMTTALILAIIAVFTTTAAALSCSDGDICVNTSGWQRGGGGAFNVNTTPIQAAVDNANAGETICVKAGNYNENVDITTPHLTLIGEGAGVVTVTAADSSHHVFEVTADYVNISGFTATGATADYWLAAGFYLYGADHCNISENDCSYNSYGIYIDSSSNNTLTSNNADSNDIGICLWSSSNNTLLNNDNLIYNNYFNNTVNACDDGSNQWNTTKTAGTNIIGGPFLGGNYWSDYAGVDNDGDGLGDTLLPYNSAGKIHNGGDYHPLVSAAEPPLDEPPAFTTADAVIALRIAVGSYPLDLYWDVSGDGQVTSLDALMIVMDTGTG